MIFRVSINLYIFYKYVYIVNTPPPGYIVLFSHGSKEFALE